MTDSITKPSIYMETQRSSVIRRLTMDKRNNQTIGILGNRSWYVQADTMLEELADDLTEHPSVQAVAVVGQDNKTLGVIIRRDLMTALARPYGRDVLRRRTVLQQAIQVPSFEYNQNIHTVNESLGNTLHSEEVSWYLLTDTESTYRGLFSSREMLIYMSDLSLNDLNMARNIQRKLTGEVSSIHEMNFDLVASSTTAKGVGGDFYSVEHYDTSRWVISVCDVSGKGVSASLITSVIWGMSSIYDFKKGVGEFVKQVNRYLFRTFEAEKFVTGVFLDFKAVNGELTVCDMGHSYIYLYRGESLKRLKTNNSNLPIGITGETEPVLNKMKLKPGDIILIPTDGLLEQENTEGALYTPERIQYVMNQYRGAPLDDIHGALISDFNEFRKGQHLHDDVTYVLLKYFLTHNDGVLGL